MDRDDLRSRIAARVDLLDDHALRQLDSLLGDEGFGMRPGGGPAGTDAEPDEPRLLSRRQVLGGLLAGGAVMGGSHLATAVYAREQGVDIGRQLGAEAGRAGAAAAAAPTRQAMQAEIDALRGLVAHYEALERLDIDLDLARSIEDFGATLLGLPVLSGPLALGVATARAAIGRFEETIPAIQQGIDQVDGALQSLDERLDALRQTLAALLERAGPVADSLGEFFDAALERIPFGIGERIELVVTGLRQLIETVPTTVASVRDRLLSPLRSTWFTGSDGGGVQAGLLTPLRSRLVEPAQELLAALDDLAAKWQREVAEPARSAMARRRAQRAELAAYRQRHGLG